MPGENARDIATACTGVVIGRSADRGRTDGRRAADQAVAALERIGRREPMAAEAVRDVAPRLPVSLGFLPPAHCP